MKTSYRNRPLCKDEGCTVEVEERQKYCNGHAYLIMRWLARSQEALIQYRILAEAK